MPSARRGRARDRAGGRRVGEPARCRRSTGTGARPASPTGPREQAEPRRAASRTANAVSSAELDERDVAAHHVADRRGRGTGSGCSRAAARRRRRRGPARAAARRAPSPRRRSVWPRSTNSTKPGQAALVELDVGAPVRRDGAHVGARRRSCRPCRSRRRGRCGGRRTSARAPGSITSITGTGQLRAQLVEAGRGRGVAGDDDRLHVVVLDEAPRQLAGEAAHLGLRACGPYG